MALAVGPGQLETGLFGTTALETRAREIGSYLNIQYQASHC
jgi:hypothetical protein